MHQRRPNFTVNAEALRAKRMAAGIEMDEMATRAGVSRRYISHLETGSRRHPKPGTYARLRKAYNATDKELLIPEDTEERK